MTSVAGVYRIRFEGSDRVYIGSSADLPYRQSIHLRSLQKGCHDNPPLQNAFRKYGEDRYRFEIIRICDPVDCVKFEQIELDAVSIDCRYNIRIVATSNLGIRRSGWSEETRRKHEEYRVSDETRRKIGDANRGRILGRRQYPVTDETRQKLSDAARLFWANRRAVLDAGEE